MGSEQRSQVASDGASAGAAPEPQPQPEQYQNAPVDVLPPGSQFVAPVPSIPAAFPGEATTPTPYPYGYGYGQPATWSMPLPGYPVPSNMPPIAKKRRRGLWITLIILLLVLSLSGGAGTFTFIQYRAPQDAALRFCSALQHQEYLSAYDLLSTSLKRQYAQQVFTDAANTLDAVEGKVSSCAQSASDNGYSHALFGDSATFRATILRATQGTHEGTIQLTSENGVWKVARWDAALMGINLGALNAVTQFCSALASGDVQGVYSYFGLGISASLTQSQWASISQAREYIDGAVTSCKVVSISQQNTDTMASVNLSVKRAKVGELTGQMQLGIDDGSWKITDPGDALVGTSLGPYFLATDYCSILTRGDLKALYDLFSTSFRDTYSFATVSQWFTLNKGNRFAGCKYYYDLYEVDSDTATFEIDVYIATASGGKLTAPTTLYFVWDGEDWKIDDFHLHDRG